MRRSGRGCRATENYGQTPKSLRINDVILVFRPGDFSPGAKRLWPSTPKRIICTAQLVQFRMSETRLPVPIPVQVAARNSKGGAHRWLKSGDAIANVLITATMIGLVWGSIWLHLTQQRQEVMSRAVRDSGNLARAAAESVGQTIAGVDDALRFILAV